MNNIKTDIIIVRPTYYDRSAMLQLSLEFQQQSDCAEEFDTFVFVDPHPLHGYTEEYDSVINTMYNRINWPRNSGKYSWYDSVKYIFDNSDYNYVLSIEDDIIISKDYLKLCKKIVHDKVLDNHSVLYFHIGAWEKPKGNPNKILRSGASSRSILINRTKFHIIEKWIKNNNLKDNDHMVFDILHEYNMTTVAPEMNRHGHFGIYGWSSNHKFGNIDGQKSIFDKDIDHDDLYKLLKNNCMSGDQLLLLNNNKSSKYFWDFNPNISFDTIQYQL